VVAADTGELADKLRMMAARIEANPAAGFALPACCYSGTQPPEPGRIAYLFPGQGSQYIGMGADLAMQLPAARAAWDAAAALRMGDRPLHRVVFPIPVFTEAERQEQQALLTATEWAQPALAAHSLALLGVLNACGLRPDCVAGHSFGELVALHAAGAYDADTLLALARRRRELMRHASATPGVMLAVTASRTQVEILVGDLPQVWIANDNAPDQVVLAGTADSIDAAGRVLAADGLRTRPLATATAFHSPLVADAVEPLRTHLAQTPVRPPHGQVYGNADAAPYPVEPERIRQRIAEHLACPVRFAEQIEATYADGARTFIEVGAGNVLTGLVRRILGDRPHHTVSLDHREVHGMTVLHRGLGRLAVAGVSLDLAALWDGYAASAPEPDRPRMAVQILGANYGKPYPPPGGAAELPPPHPEQPAPQVSPPPPVPRAVPGELVAAMLESQRQVAEAHAVYQKTTADSHIAFLRMMETSLAGLSDPTASFSPNSAPLIGTGTAPLAVSLAGNGATPAPALPEPAAVPVAISAPPTVSIPAPQAQTRPVSAQDAEAVLLAVVADKTGYPVEILNLEMELEADLGIDSIKRVEILSALRERLPGVPDAQAAEFATLHRLGEITDRLRLILADPPSAAALTRQVVEAVAAEPTGLALGGLADTPLLVTQDGGAVAKLVAEGLRAGGISATVAEQIPDDARGVIFLGGLREVGSAEEGWQVQREALRVARALAPVVSRAGGVFVTVQDTGGDFGLGGHAGERAWLGGLVGLARTAAREWPTVAVKAIDCERGARTPQQIADALVAELRYGGPAPDVGLRADGTRCVLRDVDAPAVPNPERIPVGPESVLVLSGGARGVTSLVARALARAHKPHLVLLGRTPLAEEPPYAHGVTDPAALTRLVVEHRQREAGVAPTPTEATALARGILAGRELRATLEEIGRTGAPVRYLAVDVRDREAVAAALAQVRRDWGPVTGIVHGAGVLADKRIEDKTDEQFELVFGTKVEGLQVLLAATADDPLTLLCAFSSVAARHGNTGQSDYAMANETLDQVLAAQAAHRPGCLVRALDWGPWNGGMVTPALAIAFTQRGVDLIEVDAGAAAFLAELDAVGTRVLLGDGELDRQPELVGQIQVGQHSHSYLADHDITGTPVLPVALALEWFTGMGGALEQVRVLRGLTLDRFTTEGHLLTVRGYPTLTLSAGDTVHYRAVAAPDSQGMLERSWTAPEGLRPLARAEIYDGRVLFHGPRFQALRAVRGVSAAGAVAQAVGLRALGWAGDVPWQTDPAAVDAGLQLAVLWAEQVLGGACLPMAVGQFRWHVPGPLAGGVRIVVRAGQVRDQVAECDVALLCEDSTVRAELLEVSLVLRPDREV
jgi:malonyl CoA-acyl carrier protein transacylase